MIDYSNYANIKGIVSVTGNVELTKDHFYNTFGKEAVDKIYEVTGIEKIKIVSESECASDLMYFAAKDLLKNLNWNCNEVNSLVVVTQSGDYQLPATSCVMHERLKMDSNCSCFDINLGCSGYIYGLWIMSKILSEKNSKGILLVGDTTSKMVNPNDRSTSLLFGDAVSAIAIEHNKKKNNTIYSIYTDGRGHQNLIIPFGGYRNPINKKKLIEKSFKTDFKLSNGNIFMDGTEIFKFTLSQVIPSIKNTIYNSGKELEEFDYFVFHQANMFLINHITKKLKINPKKVLNSIELFGNTSSASIPLTLSNFFGENKLRQNILVCLAGFGVGYSWGTIIQKINKDTFFKTLELNKK